MIPPPEISHEKPKRFLCFPKILIKRPGLDIATALVASIIGIHWVVERMGGSASMPEPFIEFGLSWSGVCDGKIWQVVSYALLHGNWGHLFVNVLMLWLLGGRVIHILGYRAWFKIVFCGVLAGGVLHLITSMVLFQHGFPDYRLVGISGACYALLLILTTLSPDARMLFTPITGRYLGLGVILCELLLWLMMPALGIPVLSTMGVKMIEYGAGEIFQISHACHFGGAVVGWWIASRMLAPLLSLEQLQKMRAEREGE